MYNRSFQVRKSAVQAQGHWPFALRLSPRTGTGQNRRSAGQAQGLRPFALRLSPRTGTGQNRRSAGQAQGLRPFALWSHRVLEQVKTAAPLGRLRALGPSLCGCRRISGSLQNQMKTSFHLVLKPSGCPARRGEYFYILCHYITGKEMAAMLY